MTQKAQSLPRLEPRPEFRIGEKFLELGVVANLGDARPDLGQDLREFGVEYARIGDGVGRHETEAAQLLTKRGIAGELTERGAGHR